MPERGKVGRSRRSGSRLLLSLWLSLCALGCDACAGPKEAAAPPAPPPPKPKTVVEGVVRLAPGAELPMYSHAEMEKKVLDHTERAPLPQACTPPKLDDRRPVKLTGDGLLSGVMVAASEFSKTPSHPPTVREVTIEDCRLTPSLVVAQKGDILRIKNTVDYAFMPSYGETPFVKTLIPGQTLDNKLEEGGVKSILCGFTAPCGRTDVVVVYHPLHAVTTEEGFRIEGFPSDEKVKLTAWHPLFKEASIELTVGQGETRKVELVLEPLPHATPPPDAGAGEPKEAAADAPVKEPAPPAREQADAPEAVAPN